MIAAGTMVGDYRILRGPLGKGSAFGDVYAAEDTTSVIPESALKVHKSPYPDDVKRFYLENEVMHKLKGHSGVVAPYTEVIKDSSNGYEFYCMELGDEGMADYIVRNSQLSPVQLLDMFKQIALALKHAHENSVVHRDMHSGNLLVFDIQNEVATVKITDFGRAKHFDGEDSSYEAGQIWGRRDTHAPEVYFDIFSSADQTGYAQASDIYSLGVLLAILFKIDIMPYLGARQLSLANLFVSNAIGTIRGDIANLQMNIANLNDRKDWYDKWVQAFDYDDAIVSMYPDTGDSALDDVLARVIYSCCHADYRRRFSSVDDILEEMDGIC